MNVKKNKSDDEALNRSETIKLPKINQSINNGIAHVSSLQSPQNILSKSPKSEFGQGSRFGDVGLQIMEKEKIIQV